MDTTKKSVANRHYKRPPEGNWFHLIHTDKALPFSYSKRPLPHATSEDTMPHSPAHQPGLPANTPLAATPSHKSPSATALRHMAHTLPLSPEALEASLRFLGIRPGPQEWKVFWQRLLLLCGTLLLACGIMFLVAWNWADMPRLVKLALMQGCIAVCVALALVRGQNTTSGQLLLLAAAILIGPLLAVFGQNYQTGADLWELFRVWTVLLVPLALAQRQLSLWVLVWLVGTLWGVLYMGRLSLVNVLFTTQTPPFFFAQFLFITLWEYAAFRQKAEAWLAPRWFPRLVVFISFGLLTFAFCELIFSQGMGRTSIINGVMYVVAMAAGWWWYRFTMPDLFMLSCGMLSANTVLVALLVRGEFMFHEVIYALLAWGLLLALLVVATGKVLLHWQKQMEQEHTTNTKGLQPETKTAPPTWQDVWQHLHSQGLLAQKDAPQIPPHAATPWFVQGLLLFGGWLACLLLQIFLLVFAEETMGLSTMTSILLTAPALLAMGIPAMHKTGFPRQFGFACTYMGATMAVGYLLVELPNELLSRLLATACLVAIGYFARNTLFRTLAAATCFTLCSQVIQLALAMALPLISHAEAAAGIYELLFILWWSMLCIALAWGWLHEQRWATMGQWAAAIPPLLYGLALSLAFSFASGLSARYMPGLHNAFFLPLSSLGVGAGAGCFYMAYHLTKGFPPTSPNRLVCLCAAALVLVMGWYLPGVALALLWFSVGRYMGNTLFIGSTSVFLFANMVYYYYTLATTLLHKSITLACAGIVLLLLGNLLPRALARQALAHPKPMGDNHA